MSLESSEAIVIRQADWSESSRVVTLFSRDFGKLSCAAKGAKRLRSAFDSALDLLARVQIAFIRKSSASLDLLTEAKLVSRFRPPADNIRALYAGYYVAELLSGLTEEYDPHPRLFDAAGATLDLLASGEQNSSAVLVRFEADLLFEIGQLPNVSNCQKCGRSLPGESPENGRNDFVFWVSQGGVLCGSCYRNDIRQQTISPTTLRWIEQVADNSQETLLPSDEQTRELRRFLHSAVTHVLGRRPKMSRYLFS